MTITDDMVERSARELCRYTWERAGFGKQALDVYVDYNWKDHAVGARRSLTAALEGSVAVPAVLSTDDLNLIFGRPSGYTPTPLTNLFKEFYADMIRHFAPALPRQDRGGAA